MNYAFFGVTNPETVECARCGKDITYRYAKINENVYCVKCPVDFNERQTKFLREGYTRAILLQEYSPREIQRMFKEGKLEKIVT